MPRLCRVCTHAEADAINTALLAPDRCATDIAKRYGVGLTSLYRHYNGHIGALVQSNKELRAMTSTLRLVQRLAELDACVDRLLQRAEATGDDKTALLAVREARANVMAVFQIGTVSEMEQRLQALEQGRVIDGYLGEPDDTSDYDDDTEENADG
jgi:hypothetical protein